MSRRTWLCVSILSAVFLTGPVFTRAQTADQAWLRDQGPSQTLIRLQVRALGHDVLEESALSELQRKQATGPTSTASLSARAREAFGGEIVLGTAEEVRKAYPNLPVPTNLLAEGFWLYWNGLMGEKSLSVIAGGSPTGVLYGAFAFLRFPATENRTNLSESPYRDQPAYAIRWVDEWDNPDGSIERGYAGRSIFFEGGNVRDDLAPVSEYGRLLASIGINGCNINNVNAAPQLLDSDHLKQIARIADAFRPWGVHLAMSVAIASPQTIGGLATYDPLDPAVKAWWTAKVDEIFSLIPDFAGFTVKADSEGQPGPASFGRTPADAANILAAALAPHGGIVLYRAFVYNHHLDWHDPKADRARAAYDIFKPLDGKFLHNVVIQIKEGPIDFQAREPVSPLFAGLEHTPSAMEVQITQEYTGQQRHLVYLAPMWKWVLDTDLHAGKVGAPGPSHLGTGESVPLKAILEGKVFPQPPGGLIGVAGIGRDRWLNSPLALANLYAFGRLAWNPNLDPARIADEWIKQTISTDPQVVATIQKMLLQSWPAYEDYTGPLGLQTLTDITGSHYGPNIESSEHNGWGQWHDADAKGVGKDRSVATGSGFAGQYPPTLAQQYENPATTPDNLLLFFHHVAYTYKLHNGKTVIQTLYDKHFDGAAQAASFVTDWQSLQGKIDPALYADVLARLQYQASHAIVWRDAVVQYFLKRSGIPDERGRAGQYPGRLEAEDARLTGYQAIYVTPWEDASRGKAISCPTLKGTGFSPYITEPERTGASAPEGVRNCTAEWTFTGAPGRYSIAVQYFDLPGGSAHFTLSVDNQPAASWTADAHLPSNHPNGDNSTRYTLPGVDLKTGDTLRIAGQPDGADPAALDYIEITPSADH